MKFVIDMNLSPRWCETLAAAGHEAIHWSQIGPPDAADSEVLSKTKARSAILYTHDLDFGAILAAGGVDAPSVVQIRTQNP